MFDITTIGDTTLDTFIIIDPQSKQTTIDKKRRLLSLHYGEKICIEKTDQSIGGNAANVAVGLKRLGFRTGIVTELGDDITGHIIAHEINHAGVDTSFVKHIAHKESRYSIVLNYGAERTILSYYAPRSYTLPPLLDTKWIYYTSLGKTFERLQRSVVAHLKKNPAQRLAMNPGSYQLENGINTLRKILPFTSVLFVNKEEAQKLLEKRGNPKQLVHGLVGLGVQTVVITDSTNGSYASDDKTIYHMPPYPVEAIGKTGAGDAYASGFLGAFMAGLALPEAMRFGSANAAGVVQKIGAQKGLLSKKGIKKIVAQFPNIIPTIF